MKVCDLVKCNDLIGIVERIDLKHFGSRQAFKHYRLEQSYDCIDPRFVNELSLTKNGIQDRVLVCLASGQMQYFRHDELEVVGEKGEI